jgi:SAM-dependent methyltransferase
MAAEPRLYTDLADWFHLITAPEGYAEEADFYFRTIAGASSSPPQSLLELGSGGGNNAFHYKHRVPTVTLTDLSADMLRISKRINPECEHVQGDMRMLRLGRTFDAVFVHDAVCYLTTLDDLHQAMQTAFVHCRPGAVTLFAPDELRENFAAGTDHGGHDGEGRAARYLEWTYDPDASDSTYLVDYAYLLHRDGEPTRTVYDQHVCGLFTRKDWLRLLGEVGFVEPQILPFEHSEVPPGSVEVFVARRPW